MAHEPTTTTWQRVRTPLLIFAFALTIRVGYSWGTRALSAPIDLDEPQYIHLAQSLLEGGGYSLPPRGLTAFRPPVYPIFLAGVFAVTGVHVPAARFIQLVVSALTCVLIYYLIRACRLKGPAPLFGAIICALHPLHWILAGMLFAETLYFAALVALLLLCVRTSPDCSVLRAVAIGVVIGVIALLRSEAVLYLGLVPLWMLSWRISRRRRAILTSAILAGGILTMSPWWVRNYMVFHRFIPLTTNGGVVLWHGNNPLARGGTVDALPENWRGDPPPPDIFYRGWSSLSELESGDRFRREAIRWIRENPGRFLLLLPRKAVRMLRVDARGNFRDAGVNWSLNLPYGIVLGIAVWGAILIRRRGGGVYLLCTPLIVTTVACLITEGSTRYGAPISISVAVLAAPAFVELCQRALDHVTEPVADGGEAPRERNETQ